MASLLDLGLLQVFGAIFPFLFVLTLSFAVLSKYTPFFKDNALFAGIISFCLAIITLFFPVVTKSIIVMAPWFVLLMVFFIFILIIFTALGYTETDIGNALRGNSANTIFWWTFALILIIAVGSFSTVISEEKGFVGLQDDNSTVTIAEDGSESAGFFQTIVHPKVLGMAAVMLVAFFAMGELAKVGKA